MFNSKKKRPDPFNSSTSDLVVRDNHIYIGRGSDGEDGADGWGGIDGADGAPGMGAYDSMGSVVPPDNEWVGVSGSDGEDALAGVRSQKAGGSVRLGFL